MFDMIYNEISHFIADIMREMNNPWKIFGILAQLLFMGRFLVQWFASEKAGQSTIPLAFWYFSLLGGISLLVYGIHEREPVIIMGQTFPIIIYIRNLYLIHQAKKEKLENASQEAGVIIH